jgi:hypothetical protein
MDKILLIVNIEIIIMCQIFKEMNKFLHKKQHTIDYFYKINNYNLIYKANDLHNTKRVKTQERYD